MIRMTLDVAAHPMPPARPRPGFGVRDRANHHAIWMLEQLFGFERLAPWVAERKRRNRDRLLATLARRGPGRHHPIERRRGLDARTFRRTFLRHGVPVILEGAAADWPCCGRWTLDWLAEHYGDEPLGITDYGDPTPRSLREVVEDVHAGRAEIGRCGPILHGRPELLEDLGFDELKRYRDPATAVTSLQFFLGGAGCFTSMHAGATNNLSVQVTGSKRWRLIDPRFSAVLEPIAYGGPHFDTALGGLSDPVLEHVDVIEAEVHTGDILFIPSMYWHCVSYLEDCVNVGIRWFSPRSALRSSPMMVALMAAATKPSALESALGARFGKLNPFQA